MSRRQQCWPFIQLALALVNVVGAAPEAIQMTSGNDSLLRGSKRVDQIIWPNDKFKSQQLAANGSELDWSAISYVIDHKRFVESFRSRCFASTILDDPDSVEPSFVFIHADSEVRLMATASKDDLLWLAGFEAQKPTVIIVHGFWQSYPDTDWLRNVRELFKINQSVADFNLIFMDWARALTGSYGQAAAMISGMGSFLANLLMKLSELGADRQAIHIIGHSLGAHLAGFAGKRIRPRIGRITALDPAGPCFGRMFSNSPEDRLTPDDAMEVAVYHYDDPFLGQSGQHGHFDVYVNGGSSQPGAKDTMNSMVSAIVTMVLGRNRALSESHTRSVVVHTAQLAQTNCQQVAYECRDWSAFLAGECGKCDDQNNQCFFMGFPFQYQPLDHQLTNTDDKGYPLPPPPRPVSLSGLHQARTSSGSEAQPGRARLYVATSANGIFCLHHHQILVNLRPQSEIVLRAGRNAWRLHLELANEHNERIDISLRSQMAPGVFSYLLLSDATPARFTSARLRVRQSRDKSIVALMDHNGLSPINSVEINFMSHEDPNVRRSLSSRLCPSAPPVAGASSSSSNSSPADAEWLALEQCNPID